MAEFWERLRADPRVAENAALRASDADRDVVHDLLSEAFSDGRLTREEYDDRSTAALAAVTLGELPPLVADLLPPSTPAVRATGTPARAELRAQAVDRYRRDRRDALAGFLIPTLICVGIWAVTMFGGFFWPAFVILASGANLLQTVLRREDIVEKHLERLQRKQTKAIEASESDPDEDSDNP